MFGQSLLSAFGSAVACTTDTNQLFTTDVQTTSLATYQLNNATTSIPSNTYPGTASNITYAAGRFGQAAVFNGSSGIVEYPLKNGFLNTRTTVSVSFWFKCNTQSAAASLFSDYANTSMNIDTYIDANGKIQGTTRYSNNHLYVPASTNSYDDNNWHHLVVVIDQSGNTRKHYADGALIYTGTLPGGAWNGPSTQKITSGQIFAPQDGQYYNKFTGSIDQVRVFNTVLPQAAVTALYNETTTTATYPYVDYQLANPNSIAYYKMSNATDQLGNYNGTATDVNFNTEGKFGFAGAFNGSSSRITSGLTSGLTGTYSVSAWFTQDNISTDTAHRELISYVDVDGSTGWWIGKHNNTSQWRILGVTGVSIVNMTAQAGWNHIAVVKNSSTVYVYLNGVEVTNFAFPGYWNLGSGLTPQFNIGTQYTGTSEYWDGKIDQIRIYDSALSSSEVTTLYDEVYCQPTIVPTAHFSTVTYTGTNNTQSTNSLSNQSGTLSFQPDFIWFKNRTGAYLHQLYNSISGADKFLNTGVGSIGNRTGREAEFNDGGSDLTSFNSSGFTVGTAGFGSVNDIASLVSWNWKAGGAAVSNTDGTITSQVSANVDAGFSIVSYTGNSTSGATVGHGITSPDLVMIKCTSTSSTNWIVYATPLSNSKYLTLNLNNSADTYSNWFSSNATNFTLGQTFGNANTSGRDYIAYCFKSISGYSRVGSYIGKTAGVTIYTGFQPRFIMVKASQATYPENWAILDAVRGSGKCLNPNLSNAETDSALNTFTTSATGFSFPNQNIADAMLNENGYEYTFLAIA